MLVPQVTLSKVLTDTEIVEMEGDYIDESHYSLIIREDTDVYTDEGQLLLKFRKSVIPKDLTRQAVEAYRGVAMKRHDNRGPSAGPLEKSRLPTYVGKLVNPGKYRTHYIQAKGGKLSKHNVSNLSPSNIVGYFDKKDRNLPNGPPCRLTAFSSKNYEKWSSSIPFLQHIDGLFKQLVPDRYQIQKEYAEQCGSEFTIPETSFSTITVNYSWRTGLHKDRGDLETGFGNLIVCEDEKNPNQYKGCYTGFPQYGVCVDVRDGDFLAMNVHEWHCNTEFKKSEFKETEFNKDNKKQDVIKFKPIEIENDWHYNRMSVVCYLRKNMIHCRRKMSEMTQHI